MESDRTAENTPRVSRPDDDATNDAAADRADPPEDRQPAGWQRWARALLAVIFFAMVFNHILVRIDPRTLYQADEIIVRGRPPIPIFPYHYRGLAFFKEFLDRPGGPGEYVAANLSQYFGFRFGGAVVLTAIALLMFLATCRLISLMGGRKGFILPFVPPLLLVMIWNQYSVRLPEQIGVLAAVLAACLYIRFRRAPAVRIILFLVLLAGLYYVSGNACKLFAAVCGLCEVLANWQRMLGLSYFVASALVPWAMRFWPFDVAPGDAAGGLTGLDLKGGRLEMSASVALHAFYIALVVGLTLRKPLKDFGRQLLSIAHRPATLRRAGRMLSLARPILLLVATAAVLSRTHDLNAAAFRRFSYYSQMAMWPKVIEEARRHPPDMFTPYTCRQINRALYEKGTMPSEMFAFFQVPAWGLLPGMEMDQPCKYDTLLKLGAVNRAEHLAMESIEFWGPRPFLLRLSARIAIVKGDVVTARVLLTVLSKDIVHGDWATEQLQRLKQDPSMRSDEEVIQIRPLMQTGGGIEPRSMEGMLLALLAQEPTNRMAFEYLMADYLLTNRLDKIVEYIARLKGLGYEMVPDHYGEAILLYEDQTKTQVDLHGLKHTPRALQRHQQFNRLIQTYRGRPGALEAALQRELPDSYIRHYFFWKLRELRGPRPTNR